MPKPKPAKRGKRARREYGYVVQLHRDSVVVTDTSRPDPRWVTQLERKSAKDVAESLGVDLIYKLVPVRTVRGMKA